MGPASASLARWVPAARFGAAAAALSLYGLRAWQGSGIGTDAALHDTYYVLLQVRWVAALVIVLAVFAAVYALAEPLTGRRLPLWAGLAHAALFLGGAALALRPGAAADFGMPRGYVDPDEAVAVWSRLSTIGSALMAAGLVAFAAGLVRAARRG